MHQKRPFRAHKGDDGFSRGSAGTRKGDGGFRRARCLSCRAIGKPQDLDQAAAPVGGDGAGAGNTQTTSSDRSEETVA